MGCGDVKRGAVSTLSDVPRIALLSLLSSGIAQLARSQHTDSDRRGDPQRADYDILTQSAATGTRWISTAVRRSIADEVSILKETDRTLRFRCPTEAAVLSYIEAEAARQFRWSNYTTALSGLRALPTGLKAQLMSRLAFSVSEQLAVERSPFGCAGYCSPLRRV